MSIRAFKKAASSDEILERVQVNVQNALQPVLGCPLLDGVLIESLSLVTGPNTVNHGLGRPARGYIVVRASDEVTLSDVPGNKTASRTLTLENHNPGTVTVSLWIF